jgi:hypothetical protein|nr:MAG TPA: hypothetical protein [Caudoviricetes sp.]
MNKEELLKEFNEKVEQLRNELLSKLEDEKRFEVKLPNMYDTLYYIDDICSEVYMTNFVSSARDVDRYLRGFFFETKEEAERHLKECTLLFKIQQWTEIHNEGWEPNWSNWREDKYYIYYNFNSRELETSSTIISDNFKKLPYFKSIELAQECIDLFGEEIKEVLC